MQHLTYSAAIKQNSWRWYLDSKSAYSWPFKLHFKNYYIMVLFCAQHDYKEYKLWCSHVWIQCAPHCLLFFLDCLMKSVIYLCRCPLPPLKPWKYYLPDHWQVCCSPEMCIVCQEKKNCHILCSQLVLHIKSEVRALPFHVHTVDSWALQMCMRIKAKLFVMDGVTDNDTVMAWKYGLNMQMVRVTQMEHPWSNLKQLWCNPFCIKEKNSWYGSWFSLLLIMNALFVQSVATVPSLFGPKWSHNFLFLLSLFWPWTILTM